MRSTAHEAPIPATPVKFREAVAAWRKRDPMPKDEYDALDADARDRAWTVAAAAQADLVTDVWEAIDSAIEDGTTLEDFQEAIGAQLAEAWGGANPARVENIFRTNISSAYNQGRYSVFTAPAVKESHPYWRFDVIDDDRLDDVCADCGGVILPQDDPWWDDHLPPLHPQCRCSFTAISAEEAGESVDEEGPDSAAADGFGEAPDEEGEDWEPDSGDYPAAVGDILEGVLDR